jgi:hypothetical protein
MRTFDLTVKIIGAVTLAALAIVAIGFVWVYARCFIDPTHSCP